MNTVQEIERAIDALTPQQEEELYEWLEARQPLDTRLTAALNSGRMDDLIDRAVADYQDRNTTPL